MAEAYIKWDGSFEAFLSLPHHKLAFFDRIHQLVEGLLVSQHRMVGFLTNPSKTST